MRGMIDFSDRRAPVPLGEIPEETAIVPFGQAFTPNSPVNMLHQLRGEYPFVPIMPFPSQVVNLVLTVGVARDMIFPEGTSLFILSANADFYACSHGNAEIPTLANEQTNKSIFRPEFCWFYANQRSLSLIAPASNTFVQALCYVSTRLPNLNGG